MIKADFGKISLRKQALLKKILCADDTFFLMAERAIETLCKRPLRVPLTSTDLLLIWGDLDEGIEIKIETEFFYKRRGRQ